MVTLLSIFLMSVQPPAPGHSNELRYGHPGQSRLQTPKKLLRPDGHLFARDESSPYIQQVLKPGI